MLVQEYEYFRFDLLARLGTRRRIPIYATFQGGDVTLSAIERMVRPSSLRQCNGLIVASARERARLTQAYPRLRTPVADIPNPLDTDEWRPATAPRRAPNSGCPPRPSSSSITAAPTSAERGWTFWSRLGRGSLRAGRDAQA